MSSITFTTFTGHPKGPVEARQITRPALTGHQVFVKTTHSGVCGTDVLYHHAGIGCGHEGVGVVEKLGPDVEILKVGDRVAWGYVINSCGHCAQCQSGYIYLCTRGSSNCGTHNTDQGSFSTGAVWDERYLSKVPAAISSQDCGPLMCGGYTVWNALMGYDPKPTDHIGVVGIGGLGHLAIQFAHKMGCEVTAFSTSEGKKADALKLGAHHFVTPRVEKGTQLSVARPIDRLLITANAHIDWEMFVPVLAARASVFPMQIPHDMSEPLSVPHVPFLEKSLNVIYSTAGRWDAMNKMLAFAVLHGIRPVTERFEMSVEGIETAIGKLEDGSIRYRGVLVV